MVLPQVLDFALLIDEFALLILQLLLGDDPVVVDALTLLLEVGQQFLLLLIGPLQLAELLAHGELRGEENTLNY